jgi:hypothetical protein
MFASILSLAGNGGANSEAPERSLSGSQLKFQQKRPTPYPKPVEVSSISWFHKYAALMFQAHGNALDMLVPAFGKVQPLCENVISRQMPDKNRSLAPNCAAHRARLAGLWPYTQRPQDDAGLGKCSQLRRFVSSANKGWSLTQSEDL